MTSKSPLKIFLSYAFADNAKVKWLYDVLVKHGTDPWLDTESLLPGQDWKLEIDRGLRQADLILVCLSRKSVNKEGYVQKELRLALDKALEIPEGRVFLVPVRLEDCEIPYRLRDIQWVDLYEPNIEKGIVGLLRTLALRAEQVDAQPPSSIDDVFSQTK